MAIARSFSIGTAWAWVLAVAFGLVFLFLARMPVLYAQRWVRGVAFALFMFCFGALWWALHDPQRLPYGLGTDPGSHRPLLVKVAEVTGVSPGVVRCRANALAWLDSAGEREVEGGLLMVVRRDSAQLLPAAGDRLVIRAPVNRIDRVADPGGFDRVQWAAAQGIFHEAFVEKGNWMLLDHDLPWTALFDTWRARVSGWFDALDLGGQERALVKGLVLGVRNDIDLDQRDAFARSGTMHVLAVSGMHVGLIYWIMQQLLHCIGRRTWARWLRGGLVLVALWSFTGLTGASPSIVRAAIMFTVFVAADISARPNEPLNSISVAALGLLLTDPAMIGQLSFQLSFLAVLGIILFYKPFMRLWVAPNVVAHFCWSAVSVTMAAQILTTPLSLYAFGAFPAWFLPANLVVVTASTAAVIVAIVALLFAWVPLLGDVIERSLELLLRIMGEGAQWFGRLPGAYPAVRIDGYQCLLLYALVLLVAAGVAYRWRSARWCGAACVLLLLVSWQRSLSARQSTEAFVVYDFRGGLLAAMTHGPEHIVLADSAATGDPYAYRRLALHQRKWGLYDTLLLGLPQVQARSSAVIGTSVLGGGCWVSPCLRTAVLDAHMRPVASLDAPMDVLVLHGTGRFDIAALVAACSPKHVVLSPDMELGTRRYVRRWCEEHQLHCHDVRRQGAFILTHQDQCW